jgi:hypothetical protein
MKNYKVTTYGDELSDYTVSLDDNGVVDVDGLLPETAENLKMSVTRHMNKRGLPAVTALGQAIGPYSHLTEVDSGSVTDST